MAIMPQIMGVPGGGKCAAGAFEVTANAITQVRDLGFQPKYLAVYKLTTSGSNLVNYSTILIYDEDLSTTKQYRYYSNDSSGNGKGDVLDIPETTAGYRIANVNPQGFDFICGTTSGWAGSYRYIAIG